jgi:hypothetical protein
MLRDKIDECPDIDGLLVIESGLNWSSPIGFLGRMAAVGRRGVNGRIPVANPNDRHRRLRSDRRGTGRPHGCVPKLQPLGPEKGR